MGKEGKKDVKTEYCRVCRVVQHQVQLWTRQIEITCFHKEKEQWGRNKIITSSIKTLIAIAWAGIQMPHKISYTEEGTSPRGAAGYRLTFDFKKETSGDIREKLPVPFLRHVMQQAINLEKNHFWFSPRRPGFDSRCGNQMLLVSFTLKKMLIDVSIKAFQNMCRVALQILGPQ